MKKSVLALAMAFGVTTAFAQDLTSKKGEPILPEAGDWSIGIDATPFLQYAGNLFSGATTSNTAPTFNNYGLNQTIVGKYFVDEKTAYRGILRLGFDNTSTSGMVAQANSTATFPTAPPMVTDKWSHSNNFVGLGAGIEKRRGKTRLQGYYGADAFLWIASTSDKFTYGNALAAASGTVAAVTPANSTTFSGVSNSPTGTNMNSNDGYGNAARYTSLKSGAQIGISVRGFIGVEYFVMPKISLGGEFGWGIGFYTQGQGTQELQSLGIASGATTQSVSDIKNKTAGGHGFMIDTDRNAANGAGYSFTPSGTIRMNFYF